MQTTILLKVVPFEKVRKLEIDRKALPTRGRRIPVSSGISRQDRLTLFLTSSLGWCRILFQAHKTFFSSLGRRNLKVNANRKLLSSLRDVAL